MSPGFRYVFRQSLVNLILTRLAPFCLEVTGLPWTPQTWTNLRALELLLVFMLWWNIGAYYFCRTEAFRVLSRVVFCLGEGKFATLRFIRRLVCGRGSEVYTCQ